MRWLGSRATSIPIATGERLLTKFEFRELLEKQVASIIQADLSMCGGILKTEFLQDPFAWEEGYLIPLLRSLIRYPGECPLGAYLSVG